jgi:Cu+-exporting ATPase
MALEPMTPTADDGPNTELSDLKRHFAFCLVLSLSLLAIEVGEHFFAQEDHELTAGHAAGHTGT